jgi:hypothetical protein
MSAQTDKALPTEAEYEAALVLVQDGYDEVERINWRLGSVDHSPKDEDLPDTAPDFGDLGRLWDFIDGVDIYVEQFTREARGLRGKLNEMNMARRGLPERIAARELAPGEED